MDFTEETFADIESPRHILVVDDEKPITLLLQTSLEDIPSCEVLTTTSGQQALLLCQNHAFDLLITDYKMPGMDGLILSKRVRQMHPQVIILMLTAYNSDWLCLQAAKSGVRYILNKPTKPAELRRVVLEALAQKAKEIAYTAAANPGGGKEQQELI